MSRWVVWSPGGWTSDGANSCTHVEADWLDLDHGVLVFYADEEQSTEVPKGSPTYDGRQAKWVQRHETVTETVSTLVRAFGVGQWRDVEPLAEPPEEVSAHAEWCTGGHTGPCDDPEEAPLFE